MIKHQVSLLLLLATVGACTTNAQSNPTRTATEELLISSAADRAAARLDPALPPHTHVFVDTSNFEGTDSKYAIGCIRTQMLKKGALLVNDRKKADVIVEARAGALSIDRKSFLIGLPSFNIPIPLASSPLPSPELALYEKDEQKGLAKFAITGYDAKKGTLIAAQDPQYGFAHNTKKTVLFFISWNDRDFIPEDAEESQQKMLDAKAKSRAFIGMNEDNFLPMQAGVQSTPAASPAAAPATTSTTGSSSGASFLPSWLR